MNHNDYKKLFQKAKNALKGVENSKKFGRYSSKFIDFVSFGNAGMVAKYKAENTRLYNRHLVPIKKELNSALTDLRVNKEIHSDKFSVAACTSIYNYFQKRNLGLKIVDILVCDGGSDAYITSNLEYQPNKFENHGLNGSMHTVFVQLYDYKTCDYLKSTFTYDTNKMDLRKACDLLIKAGQNCNKDLATYHNTYKTKQSLEDTGEALLDQISYYR